MGKHFNLARTFRLTFSFDRFTRGLFKMKGKYVYICRVFISFYIQLILEHDRLRLEVVSWFLKMISVASILKHGNTYLQVLNIIHDDPENMFTKML
jgi:hypothetical protein